MKKIAAAWNSVSLILKIVIGMIIGAILGLTLPQLTGLSILGTLFVGALKAIAPVLVFVLVVSALTQARSGIGRQYRTVERHNCKYNDQLSADRGWNTDNLQR